VSSIDPGLLPLSSRRYRWFTQPAKNAADARGIQLFEVYDHRLANTSLLLPVRLVRPELSHYAVRVQHRSGGRFSLPVDWSQWRFHSGNERLTIEELALKALRNGRVPPTTGTHQVNVGAVTIEDALRPGELQCCEIEFSVEVKERYYLKLFPASFIKNATGHSEPARGDQEFDGHSQDTFGPRIGSRAAKLQPFARPDQMPSSWRTTRSAGHRADSILGSVAEAVDYDASHF
jgi:hypothetical protein